jgi:small conductance mechanosensitive channel
MEEVANEVTGVLEPDKVIEYTEMLVEMAISYGPKLVLAILTLLIGLWVINAFVRGVNRGFERSGMDVSLKTFLGSLISIGLKVLLVISVASMVGIETTSFIAVLGAAGLAVGLALQGSLANFAGGVLILIFRPYKVGDFITAAGESGTVQRIEIFSTILTTADNKTIIIPNGAISSGSITNFSTAETRRVDIVFGIGYDDDIRQAKDILEKLITSDDRILKEPAHLIVVSNLGDSAVDITTRSWVNAADYWGVHFDLLEKGKLALDEAGINIPYPQQDVHVYQQNS